MSQPNFSQKNVTVTVSDDTVEINSVSGLQLSFSPSNDLTMSVSEKVADLVCGACGRLSPTSDTPLTLGESLLISVQGQTTKFASLNMRKWKAPDFPQW